MNNLINHALREFKAAGYDPIETAEDGPDKWIQENVIQLLKVFSEQGHSGMSAVYCIGMFETLARFEPLSPLQGTEDEWAAPFDEKKGIRQNKRCSHVFLEKDGKAYDINGKVFVEPDGCSYTNKNSFVQITFPYTPKTEFIKVDENGEEIK